jgi:hypothetical protein
MTENRTTFSRCSPATPVPGPVPPHTPYASAAAPGFTADVLFVFDRHLDRFAYPRPLGRLMRGEADPKETAGPAERFHNHYVKSAAWRDALKVG